MDSVWESPSASAKAVLPAEGLAPTAHLALPVIPWSLNPLAALSDPAAEQLRGSWVTLVLNCLLATWHGDEGHSFSTWWELSLNNYRPHVNSCNSVRGTRSQHPRMTVLRLRGHPESGLLTPGYPGTLLHDPPLLKHFLVEPVTKAISSLFVGLEKKTHMIQDR